MALLALALTALAGAVGRANAFYVPILAPKNYAAEEEVPLKVVTLDSTKTQLPYDFYHAPFCKPEHLKHQSENLGEVLIGDSVQTAPYQVRAGVERNCVVACRRDLTEAEAKKFAALIDGEYRVHMMLDGLPAALGGTERDFVVRGHPVGVLRESDGKKAHYLNNHSSIKVLFHESEAFPGKRIVGFEITPVSIKHAYTLPDDKKEFDTTAELTTCNPTEPLTRTGGAPQSVDQAGEVIFTYDVRWERSDIEWAHRWDAYMLGDPEDEIHYFSVVNSLMITLFLTGVVAMIMLRTLHKDIASYNEAQTLEEAQEESGWKLVHGDVFRPPAFSPMVLSVLAGTGVQVFVMTLSTIGFAFMGFLSPANRGGMLTTVLVLFVLSGSAAGYWSARLYKLLGGRNWKRNTGLTAVLFPGTVFMIFWALNITMWIEGASTAIPFTTFASLLLMWFGVSAPLVLLGSYWGLRAEPFAIPVRVNQIARHIPEQQWYTHPLFTAALGGILPFGAVCIELFFIMSALWLHQIYYVFGFLSVVFFILVVTCAEIAIVMCYFQLCSEDYRWWWRSFTGAGSSAVYLFLYATWYYATKLNLEHGVTTAIYFGYMLIIALAFAILTGSIGFYSCFWFVRRIYAAIKVD
ncbi:putative endomembrane protein 70 [Tribonema minus]|uniref:Transmembrane 9 superfamily member n=1 Tax=Tribonema minus TaxID=303371 RepID=A0A835ZC71_9STRA|nr:putative endomembrane protein 70 [Tribonema minus]